MTLSRAAAAEAIGTALLLAVVVGSGIMGERLAQGNAAVALLANSIATGAGLYALIVIFGPVSGAHFNPVVSAVSIWDGRLSIRHGVVYVLAQISGAVAGVTAAHVMFGLPIVQFSAHLRPTLGEGLGEVVATFGLVLVILLALKFRVEAIPMAVAAFITSAYWFTSSTSFANPAVTLARAMTDTFAGISPHSVPLFVVGQLMGGALATLFVHWLFGGKIATPPE
ncbi:MAG: aquaporin family protein [Deltaproteobacteria bacterium]|jgi:glycerol uptake facilitator-like aquaporin|nr:MAG: aquaporin family protein [Deltaproteobacteria bacterium]